MTVTALLCLSPGLAAVPAPRLVATAGFEPFPLVGLSLEAPVANQGEIRVLATSVPIDAELRLDLRVLGPDEAHESAMLAIVRSLRAAPQ